MSLSVPIGAGLLIGGLAAFAVYASAAPLEVETVAPATVAASTPVPRPTVTVLAEGCEAPAVLVGGECVVTAPGPTVQVPGTGWGSQASDDDYYDHDDDEWDDDHDGDHDDDHDDDGEWEDD